MTSAKWIGAVLGIVVSLGAAQAQDLSSVSTKDLISKLQDESVPGIGTDDTGDLGGFMAINEEIQCYWGTPGPVKPVTSPVMRELVRRGAVALPALIDHLSDARPTKLVVGHGLSKWFKKQYDPRDTDKPPAGVDGPDAFNASGERHFDSYAVKVGDFCFVAVGQIVNRRLMAVWPENEGQVVINSPVETPALAAAVKSDWGGLTPADHERSLEQDALPPSINHGLTGAVTRLMFYYPEPGAALALRYLNSPLCDMNLVDDFVYRLLRAKDAGKQDRLMAQFRKEHGEANYGAMQSRLAELIITSEQLVGPDTILERAFPGVDERHPPKSAGIDFSHMRNLVDALALLPSGAIDQAVYNLLKRTSEMHPISLESVTQRCDLVKACAWRLTKPDERDAFEKSYAAVMSSLPKAPKSGNEPQSGKMTAFSKRFQAFLDDEIGRLAPH